MAILTKNQLSASNASSFPDNTTGAITPQILRDFNTSIIDTMVDSLNTGSYAILTGSNDFTQQNNFTSISASSFVSASEFVGDGSKITGITASVALPILDEGILQGYATSMNFTGSAINAQVIAGTAVVRVNVEGAGFVSTSSFNAYTASNDSKVNSLISATGSYAISSSVAAVDAAQQAQINSLIAQTGSNDNTSLNAFTASQESKNSTLATYTASVDTKFSNIGGQSGSWDNTNLNAFSASQLTKDATLANVTQSLQQQLTNIGSQSGSWITESETGSFARTNASNTFTGVQQFNDGIRFDDSNRFIEASGLDLNMAAYNGGKVNILSNNEIVLNPVTGLTTITGSVLNVTAPNAIFNSITASRVSSSFFVGDGSGLTNLPGQIPLTSLNAYTASNDTKWSNLAGQSGSWVTESETGSFARYDVSNPWSANQTFTNISAVSASFQYVQTLYETSSVIYSSGSNQFGDAAGDVQTLYGSTRVMNELTASGLHYPSADGIAGQYMVTNGAGTLTFDDVHDLLEDVRYGENITIGDPLYVSGSNGTRPVVWKADASNSAKMPVIYIASSTNVANTNTTAITLGLITGVTTTGYPAGTTIYVAEGGGWSANRPSGSSSIVQSLGIVTKEGAGGSGRGLVLNPGPATLPNLQTGYAWVGNGGNQPISVATSSFGTPINTGSFATTGSNTFIGNQTITGSVFVSGSNSIQIGIDATGISSFNKNSHNINTTKIAGIDAFTQLYAGTGSKAAMYMGVYDDPNFNTDVEFAVLTDANGTTFNDWDNGVTFGYVPFMSLSPNTGNNPTPVMTRGLVVTGSTNIQNLTASLQQGYVWVGNANGKTTTVATSSFASLVNTGSFATTGSNNFIGVESINDLVGSGLGEVYLLGRSGSLVLANSTATPTYASLSHLSSSQINANTNLIFKDSSTQADTIISGSNNIFVNPAAVTAGFKRYIGANNHYLNSSAIPQISASMAFPITMSSNVFAGTMIMRGPVSSSTWTLSNNQGGGTINIGSSAANNAQRAVSGVTTSNNSVIGTLSIIANGAADLNTAVNFSNNVLAGATTLTLSGSAVVAANNFINDSGFTLSNGYYSSSVGLSSLAMNRNNFAGQSQQLIVSGALPAGVIAAPSYSDNAMFGGNNTIFTNVSAAPISGGVALHSAIRNIVGGHQLVITGSSALALADTYGSAFFGRWNANDGRRNLTNTTIFAVGTGVNDTTRKTGFLIDSGSNTFIEGTLNVSGSSSYTGSVYGNVVSMSVTSNTASMNLALGNYFELTSSASPLRIELSNIKAGQTSTLILSASVSSSIAFSSNVGQPSPGAYSGSVSASIDILSFVAFNNSRVNLVATKNII